MSKLLIFFVTIGFLGGSGIDLRGVRDRLGARWHRVDKLFDEAPEGTESNFHTARAVETVLNAANRVLAARLLSTLTRPAQERLREFCKDALRREQLAEWAQVRDLLDLESEPFLVPRLDRISPLRELIGSAKLYVRDDQTFDSKIMEKHKSIVLRILRPVIQSPNQIVPSRMKRAYILAEEQVKTALRLTQFNGKAVVQMLEDVESTLRRKTEIHLPSDWVSEIDDVRREIRRLEHEIKGDK